MITNYRTTIAGLIYLGATISLILRWIDTTAYAAIIGAAGSFGFIVASDSKKEG